VSSIKTASSGASDAEAPALGSASGPVASSGLERIIRRAGTRRAEAAEHCDFCSAGLAERHRHLLDTDRNEPMCVCQACSLLFARDAASAGHYRLVPDRRTRLPAFSTKELGVPVGLAFFVPQESGEVIAHYPSPAGATQWEVDPEAWAGVQKECPAVATLEPGVQALLVNIARDRRQHWLVPIDDCFALVAVVRREWKGLSGGSTVWPQIDAFFEQLTERH
jgi:hypothetical protein